MRVYYTFTKDGTEYKIWDTIKVTATLPYYTIDLHYAELTEVTITEFADGVTYYTFNSTTNTYDVATEYVEGTTYYTTPVIKGDEIEEVIALKGIEKDDTYAVWAVVKAHDSANPDGEDLGTLGDALAWTISDPSIANIDTKTGVLTFTGKNYGTFTVTVSYKGADGKVITDTITISVTDSLYVVPGDGTNDFPEYPNEGAVRFDKTATAVGNFSETGIAKVELSMTGTPYTTGSAIDVLLMIDMSTSMDTEVASGVDRVEVTIEAAKAFAKTIVQNNDGTYNSNKIAIKYFNGSTVYTTTDYITVSTDDELAALNTLIEGLYTPTSTGTYYSAAMENAYNTIIAQDAVSDNTQALVFMSDGGPTYYTYLNDSGTGTTVNSSTGATFVGWFDVDDNDTSDNETDDTATPNSSFKTEYYSYLLKDAGYPIYTVGLGLSTNDTGPSSYTGLTSGAHEAITSYILSSMATNSSYFYNIADSDAVSNMGNIFSGIAASIKEAATDIVVEDKIGNDYSLNFSLPDGVTSDATDGLSEFYIQVVDYILDATTHERTGVYTVKENFTFNSDDTLKSHTVDGVVCTDCTHVTTTNGEITAINGTYFDYKSDSTGEYLTWEAEKLTSTELALQYFAYLDNSAGNAVADQIPAGTYYTNEYATLTYTNVNGNKVQQEFPVPQMTWNGAQVSYVFYLVNDAGQPVNRSGRVVPFAEAVYVTDVYTYSVIWNDMEQAAGLEAKYLAENLVPDVYALYDDDASYNIHVYEKETEVNLNNHFVIGGDVADDYNTVTNAWSNAKTTYVFNNKSDTTKYNTVGTYVTDDGDDATKETGLSYFCKSAVIEGATYTTATDNGVTVYTVTSVGDGYQAVNGETQTTVDQITAAGGSITGGTIIDNYIYYVDENGDVYTIVTKTDGAEVEKGFDFSNTTVAFAVVWKPELVPDTVVVDYGLDVVIDVTTNDAMAAGVTGVMLDAPDVETGGAYDTAVGVESVNDGDGLWTASVENLTSVRFHQNEMGMNEPETFYYEAGVNYYESGATSITTTNMYSSVTVIPATTIYYEDSFVDYKVYTKESGSWALDEDATWSTDGTTVNAVQDIDRPGMNKISEAYDADNVYGYDSAYATMSKYSLGSARWINVNASQYATAEFDFYGTGFDVISLTSDKTGSITVKVTNDNGFSKTYFVDTYYGYKYENGEWVVDADASDTLYQIPVMKVEGLEYGEYHVTIKAAYNTVFDHEQYDGTNYDFYLDAIRIYDPAGDGVKTTTTDGVTSTDATIKNAYIADGEYMPDYYEVRNNIIEASAFDALGEEDIINGIVFIDGDEEVSVKQIADYISYGPNNEVYLAPGQAIAFELNLDSIYSNATVENIADVQIGLKSVGGTAQYKLYDAKTSNESSVNTSEVATATDMYYSIKDIKNGVITVYNAGAEDSAVLSITNVKVTFKEAPVVKFAPSTLVLSVADSFGVDQENTVTVVASSDVERIVIGDIELTKADTANDDGTYNWSGVITPTEIGTYTLNVVAYNSACIESNPITATVNVVETAEENVPETTDYTVETASVFSMSRVSANYAVTSLSLEDDTIVEDDTVVEDDTAVEDDTDTSDSDTTIESVVESIINLVTNAIKNTFKKFMSFFGF